MTFHAGLLARYRGLDPWMQTGLKVVLVAIVGYLLIQLLKSRLDSAFARHSRLDPTIRIFVGRVVISFAWLILIAAIATMMGADLTALLGGLAIGGFVIGFALKDTLGNLAAGLMLLVYRPFDVGDTVTLSGHTGKVAELGMALTTVHLPDGLVVTVPNGSVLGGAIVNFTRLPTRRVEIAVGIGYDDNIDVAMKAILEEARRDPRILAEPAPAVIVTALGESSVNLAARVWVNNGDFGAVTSQFRAALKRAVEDAGCSIPFPQRDLHIHQIDGPRLA